MICRLEVCGGNGRLAKRILGEQKLEYILLERNEDSIKEARETLGDDAAVVQADIVEEKVWYSDQLKEKPIEKESIDIAIGSGALSDQVLSRDGAKKALKKIVEIIKPGGFIVLTCYTGSLVDSKDFKRHGLKIINCSIACDRSTNNERFRPFYVLSKPLTPEKLKNKKKKKKKTMSPVLRRENWLSNRWKRFSLEDVRGGI